MMGVSSPGAACSIPKPATKSPRQTYPQGSPRRGENEHPKRTDNQATTNAFGQATTNSTCGKSCKNPRGLKIHQAKMKCLVRVQLEQRTGSNLGEMQEEPGQESTHSAQNLQVPEVQALRTSQHQVRVKWPPTSKAKEWRQFDEDSILEATMKGGADRKLHTMATMI
ncbi:hypothetical protein SKAU_G00238760 [Synaphobranchus kaupii]|uniref:Uncharacterized protein n=1 Tax=Synaphobranchus kaupii TaxID=118154 RepID=A0A9Q1F782_SYNKA|nr:hypothetical protein SKAU_G00238760 [Synaphobranchus kaupii]